MKNHRSDNIVELRAAIVEYPMPEPIAAGRWVLATVCNVVALVRSASGSCGIGHVHLFRNEDGQTVLSAISSLREIVIGRDPMDTSGIHGDLIAGTNFVGAGGPSMSALGAIDVAMWDLKGKLLDVPVHALLGSTRTRIPAYASGGSFRKSLDELQREMEGYIALGFKVVKIKLPPDPREACGRIAGFRSRLPDDIKVIYDSNQQQTYKAAVEIAGCCADNGAYWYEEPLPFWQLPAYADLRRTVSCRLAMGETLYGEHPFSDAIRVGAADVLMLNLHKVGGVTAWMRVAASAALAGIPISSHTMPEVSAQLISATPRAEMLEYMRSSAPLYEKPFPVEGGFLVISPDGPGLGLPPSKLVLDKLGID